jgi:hypothetical protein
MKDKASIPSPVKSAIFILNYIIGFFYWLAGAHCWARESTEKLSLAYTRVLRHFFKVFLWALELCLLWNLMGVYREWLLKAAPGDIAMAFLVKSVIFLYVKIFWPRVFPEILPGLHVFFCPQCYKRQSFRFMPVSIRFGHYVTYLCGHCSCLVDGWGSQLFYPADRTKDQIWIWFGKTMVVSVGMIALGVAFGMWVWGLF